MFYQFLWSATHIHIICVSVHRGACSRILHRRTFSMLFRFCWGYLHYMAESMGNIASSCAKNRIQKGNSLGNGVRVPAVWNTHTREYVQNSQTPWSVTKLKTMWNSLNVTGSFTTFIVSWWQHGFDFLHSENAAFRIEPLHALLLIMPLCHIQTELKDSSCYCKPASMFKHTPPYTQTHTATHLK